MINKQVIIRVDGNPIIGLGHIYRCLALAEMLKEDFKVEFLTRCDTTISPIDNSEFKYKHIPENVCASIEPEWLKESYESDTIIVLDGYQFNEKYQQKLKDFNFKLVYIDDSAKGIQNADLIINHSPGAKENNYILKNYSKLALGLEYALLRKSFINFERTFIKLKKEIKNILICFGGTDIHDFSFQAVKEVANLEFVETVNVILGSAYQHKAIYHYYNPTVKLHKNLSEQEVFNIMKETDIAIVPASTISIELASLGIPMILGYTIENQKHVHKGFIENEKVTDINDYCKFNFSKLTTIIKDNNNSEKLNKQSTKLLELFNGNPKNNIRKAFNCFNISIREATEDDLMFIYELSQEPLVRKNSYHSEEINLNEHKDWFISQINNKNTLFYIIEFENQRIAQVRFNIKKDYSIIGISIINKYRGKGLASEMLINATSEYYKKIDLPIYAYIKKTNLASVKTFERARFYYYKEEVIHHIDSYIYKKENVENC